MRHRRRQLGLSCFEVLWLALATCLGAALAFHYGRQFGFGGYIGGFIAGAAIVTYVPIGIIRLSNWWVPPWPPCQCGASDYELVELPTDPKLARAEPNVWPPSIYEETAAPKSDRTQEARRFGHRCRSCGKVYRRETRKVILVRSNGSEILVAAHAFAGRWQRVDDEE